MSPTELESLGLQQDAPRARKSREARERVTPSGSRAGAPVVGAGPNPALTQRTCVLCGRAARVQVLQDYLAGEPLIQNFCLTCAHDMSTWPVQHGPGRSRLRLSTLLGLVGCVLGALVLLSDWLVPPHVTAGFGWHKECGLLLGALLVLIGVFARADVVVCGGALVFGATLVAGLFGLSHSPGFGYRQQALLVASVLCVGVAILVRLGVLRAVVARVRAWGQ